MDRRGATHARACPPPCYGRYWKVRLNYNHLFLDGSGNISPYIHLVFVRKQDYQLYVQHWGHFVAIIEIPEEMIDISENIYNGGVGYARRFIQRFCMEYKIKSFYMADDSIVYLSRTCGPNGQSQNINMNMHAYHLDYLA